MIKRILSITLILMLASIAFTGCDRSADSSYAGILIVNEKEYIWHGEIENNEYTIGERIGEVQRKVDAKVLPKSNFSSNLLETGEEIYTSKEDSNVIIVIRKNGSLDKFARKMTTHNQISTYKEVINEYNSVGDIIMEYNIWHDEVYTIYVMFYDYEYNEDLLPQTVTAYRVQSPIAKENIRDGCI